MSETATLEPTTTTQNDQTQDQVVTAAPEVSQVVADNLWGVQPTVYQNVEQQTQQATETQTGDQGADQGQQTQEADDVIDLDDYFQREFGMPSTDFRSKWDELNKPREEPKPQEIQWANEDSRRLFDAIREGKTDDVYNYLNQQQQLARLEKYDITDANQAAEIIRANLQFKYKDLSTQEIDRLFSRQYSMPPQPQQALDQADGEFEIAMEDWRRQVQEKQTDMIIDAKLAKPELSQYKSQIVLPEIQKPQVQQAGPSQEELAAMEAGRKAYLDAIDASYQNFKGFTVTAKDGEVQLPISYNVTPEEQAASKELISSFNVNDFFEKRWFDENGSPKVNLIQEDLYLLTNRDKIHQKIATEAFTQMKAHLIKNQNNINLKGVNSELGPLPTQQAPQNTSQTLAENIWKM